MEYSFLLVVFIAITLRYSLCQEQTDCLKGPSTMYTGTRSITTSGRTCQRWDVDKPHKPTQFPKDKGDHNYCRNPDYDIRGTWCYTTDVDKRWEYCNIVKCPDDSRLMWTSAGRERIRATIMQIHADPEVAKHIEAVTGSSNTTTVVELNNVNSEYWALASHYAKKKLYYTDYRLKYLGVWDINKGEETRYFQGMAHGIEQIAIDWSTNNIYWTDSTLKLVMVADSTLTHYATVYKTVPDPTYGLAIHSVKGYLIFSTFKVSNSKIIRTDLAGKNAFVLQKYPAVTDVTGITVDYEDDILYWTDFTGFGSSVMSSRIDGTNKTQHYYTRSSILRSVVIYQDYIYATDTNEHTPITGEPFYYIKLSRKKISQYFSYQVDGKPNAITIFCKLEGVALDGDCNENGGCDHICLPRKNATRESVHPAITSTRLKIGAPTNLFSIIIFCLLMLHKERYFKLLSQIQWK